MKPSVIVAIGIVVSYAALAHEGHEHATGVVRERMELIDGHGQASARDQQTAPQQIPDCGQTGRLAAMERFHLESQKIRNRGREAVDGQPSRR